MRRSQADQIENAMKPYGLIVAKEMPIRVPLENKVITLQNTNQ